jgi:N-acetylglucosaminyldiphosphoundecaprenol N-acetyl-beta-D-mannosaminyltransferase
MTISIITPSYGQLDWLKLCVASVADQVGTQNGGWKLEAGSLGGDAPAAQGVQGGESRDDGRISREEGEVAESNSEGFQHFNHSSPTPNSQLPATAQSPLAIEHIIQDGGTPGIEEFAREVGAEFYRDGKLVFGARPSIDGTLLPQSRTALPGSLRSSTAPAPAGLVFDARLYRLAIYCEPDAGMYDAINKGIAKIRGDLWAWINSDEQYLPGTLAYVAEWFRRHPDADILCGDALLTDEGGNAVSYRRIVKPLWRHTRLVHLASLSCASFYRRSIVDRGGVFDTGWRSIGDAEWMARMMRAGVNVKACRRLLSTYAFTGQNTSESPLAGEEAERWRLAADAPPSWQTRPMIWLHRFRKFLAGAYRYRTVRYALHSFEGQGRVMREKGKVGWGWPSASGGESPMGNSSLGIVGRGKSAISNQRSIRAVLGTDLLVTTYRDLSRLLINRAEADKGPLAVDFANTQIVTMRRHDRKFERLAESIDLTVPDGMPLVWAMNRKGAGLKDRVYGPTFTREFLGSCPAGKTHYLIGGSEECGRRFRERMLLLNPSLQFIGGYHGLCSAEGVLKDDEAVLADIREKRPDFIWVGLGTPKQYAWIHRIKPQLDRGVLLAVGFAFDVNAGMKADAPIWMQRAGLTWLHRMATEPRRLLGRYLKWNTLFLWYWMKDGGWRSEDGVGESKAEGSRLGSTIRRWKLMVRNLGLKLIALFSTEIRDCVTGESLGKGLVLSLGGRLLVIGHPGLPPLIPRFLSQKRLTYWKQSIGFTTHRRPDYPRLACVKSPHGDSSRVMNVVLTHLGGAEMERTLNNWKAICREEDLWIAFGGSQDGFEALEYPRKVFVDDPYLRRIDNQRQKQSYTGIFRAMAPVVEREKPDFIYLCEYDHLPLVRDLNGRQVAEIRRKDADVMGHWLHRVDGTSNYHMLYHETDPGFAPFWRSFSRREDAGTVFSMFGSGSLWSREAFLAVAYHPCPIACYLELYLPTLVHHHGFRVCGWDEEQHLLSNLPSRAISEAQGRRRGAWTVHPVKG